MILGVLVAIWHTPSFLLSGTKQSTWDFWPFFLGVVAISVLLTAMFNDARGSLLVAFLFHAQLNNPIWPDAQPWDMWLFVVAAVVVIVVKRKTMLDRDHGVTGILLPGNMPENGGHDNSLAHHDADDHPPVPDRRRDPAKPE